MQTPTTLYFDHAATTPLRAEAFEAMRPYLEERFANASSLYGAAREARKAIEDAREQIAQSVGARPEEVVFTGSGTEADNLALKGVAWHAREQMGAETVVAARHAWHWRQTGAFTGKREALRWAMRQLGG